MRRDWRLRIEDFLESLASVNVFDFNRWKGK